MSIGNFRDSLWGFLEHPHPALSELASPWRGYHVIKEVLAPRGPLGHQAWLNVGIRKENVVKLSCWGISGREGLL